MNLAYKQIDSLIEQDELNQDRQTMLIEDISGDGESLNVSLFAGGVPATFTTCMDGIIEHEIIVGLDDLKKLHAFIGKYLHDAN